jgi:glyoxylase-like metal-dependent hydrolase (beta-lactamase superfamily II)
VLFDAGLGTQAAKQKRLLQDAAPGPMKYIILSHSHADHLGATKYWRAKFPDVKVITYRLFSEG